MNKKTTLIFILAMLFTTSVIYAQSTIFSNGTNWNFYDDENKPADQGGTDWNDIAYDDTGAGWTLNQPAELGYGDSDEATAVNSDAYTVYFRKSFTASAAQVAFSNLELNLTYDDGAVVYLNGIEVWSVNMPGGRDYSTFASSDSGDNASASTSIANSLVLGNNVISVEVHQRTDTSSDLSFDLELLGSAISDDYISDGDVWKYYDSANEPVNDDEGDTWKEVSFDDSLWASGASELGYGDTQSTLISSSTLTGYFRKSFTVTDHTLYGDLSLEAIRDDGMVVYLNGIEVWRDNMPAGSVSYGTFASGVIGSTAETTWINQIIANNLVTGTNTIAVEIHQENAGSSDISFNFKLKANGIVPAEIKRGPYLQSGTPTSVIIKWRTNTSTESIVNYGTNLGSLSTSESDLTSKIDHEITLSGLTPNTKYYFNIANLDGVFVTESSDMYIITAPTIGTDQFVRAWILGDAGTANQDQRDVRDAYYNYVASASTNPGKTDMMLFLGDNAYNSGTDPEYQAGLFDIYDDMLKKSVSWSCLGNHDGYSADSNSQTGPYYDIFTFPTAAESGGTASGTEAYYSFDYANIHFIILDSYETSRTVGGTMYNWAEADIQNTTQDWIVVLFHHPPYTKGSHNSDTETELIEMRENFMPMLEDNGVDLILSGHSHCYERSYFLNGHQGISGTFNSTTHTVGANGDLSGKADTADGAYAKTNVDTDGAVYITTGSAGKETGGSLNHAAMYHSVSQLGSCILEIEDDGSGGQNLTVKFLRETEAVGDYFTINKTGVSLSADAIEPIRKNIKLFPVPANDLLNINVNLNEHLQSVKFYNSVGKLVKESEKQTINVSNMKTGMYIIEIATDKNTYHKSIIIE